MKRIDFFILSIFILWIFYPLLASLIIVLIICFIYKLKDSSIILAFLIEESSHQKNKKSVNKKLHQKIKLGSKKTNYLIKNQFEEEKLRKNPKSPLGHNLKDNKIELD